MSKKDVKVGDIVTSATSAGDIKITVTKVTEDRVHGKLEDGSSRDRSKDSLK